MEENFGLKVIVFYYVQDKDLFKRVFKNQIIVYSIIMVCYVYMYIYEFLVYVYVFFCFYFQINIKMFCYRIGKIIFLELYIDLYLF